MNCGDTLSVPGGQYVLTGNLACPASPAVHITGNNVHFDLKGLLNSDHNHIFGNNTNTNRGAGIHIEIGSAKNLVVRNLAQNNASFDLADDNRNCGANDWDSNSFGTRSQSCIQ